VRVVRVPEQPGVVALREQRHPPVAVRRFELVFLPPVDLVDLVQEQHGPLPLFSWFLDVAALGHQKAKAGEAPPERGL
jgi:hypothetical protein